VKKEVRSGSGALERRDGEEDAQDAQKITGYAAVFNTWATIGGWWEERIAPGAFSKSIAEHDVRALFNHDSNFVLGRNRAGTLTLAEDARGLYFNATPPDTQWARDLVTSIKRGDISQCSIGFFVRKQEWDDTDPKMPKRTIIEVELFDVSPVTYPAFEDTQVDVRSLEEWRAANRPPPAFVNPHVTMRMRMDLGLRSRQLRRA
jgi:HK97 family phage prohead protease